MHPSSLYTYNPISKIPLKESYSPLPHVPTISAPARTEPNPGIWMRHFWNACHVLARTYNPVDDKVRKSFACFYQSLSDIIPTYEMRRVMKDFILMTKEVQDTLFESKILSTFFTVHREIYDELIRKPRDFFNFSLKDSDSLFIWTYLLHCYYNLLTGVRLDSYNMLKATYDRSQISKETWANPIWALIHICAYYAPAIIDHKWAMSYKAFISCLMFAIPCPTCRNNLVENLGNLNIDNYLRTNKSIFEYSVLLHNSVNKELNKPIISVAEAEKIYSPYSQALIRQNANFNNFGY
jgi:hypothetical protein